MAKAEPEANGEFLSEFLDDYFVECDEHLTIIRRNLLALEAFVSKPRIDNRPLEELLLSFHTLKGISGMVGVYGAEQLAHHIESYLRGLRDGRIILSAEGMEVLIGGSRLIEQVVAERRARAPSTDITPVIQRIAAILPDASAAGAEFAGRPAASPGVNPTPALDARLASAIHSGNRIWRFEFTPLPELVQRGINVNAVRARLQEIGELISAVPRVMPEGGISFEFVVASSADKAAFESWRDDGLTHTPYEEAASAGLESTEGSEARPVVSQSMLSLAPSTVVRVDLGRLDELMRMVGDLVVSRSRLDENLKRLERDLAGPQWRPLQETNLMMERQLRDLREGVMRVRMVPIGEIFERMRFVIRDLAREYDKRVILEMSGQNTEVDKLLVERMMDAMLHLVRNAVSHGLETTRERIASGKPLEGKIRLGASTAAEMVVIEIEDDGRGIDQAEVVRRAQAKGLTIPEAAVDNATLLDLICEPGFSTRDLADRASGRGIGMNVVENAILGLGGSFELDTEAGRGTRFTIQLPLTLAIADALIVSAGDQRFAVPQSSVREVIEVNSAAVRALENNELISYRGGVLPLLRLAWVFHLDERTGSYFHVFVVGAGGTSVGIAVDRILGQREIVVRAISDPLIQVTGIAGATELGDGRIVLILDAKDLALASQRLPGRGQYRLGRPNRSIE